MTERAEQTLILLRSCLEWVPSPRTTRYASKPGFATDGAKRKRCVTCGATGHVIDTPAGERPCPRCKTGQRKNLATHGCRPCLVCDVNSPGWRRVRRGEEGEDPMRNEAKGAQTSEALSRYDLARRRDQEIARLEAVGRQRDGSEAEHDTYTAAVQARDREYRHGSYRELWAALDWLRERSEPAYHVVMQAAVYNAVPMSEPVRAVVDAACELLAARMPDPIRIPSHLQPASQHEASKESLWRGRTERHARRRDERNREILGKLGAGLDVGQVASFFGMTPRRVQQLAVASAGGASVQ